MRAELLLLATVMLAASCQLVCLHNDANNLCKVCIPSYYLTAGICKQCPIVGCAQCDAGSNTSCAVCKDGYTRFNTTTTSPFTCVWCPKGQYYNVAGTIAVCAACIPNCLYCADNTTCTQCQPGYSLLITTTPSTTYACQNSSLFSSTALTTPAEWRSQLLDLMPGNRPRLYNSTDLSYVCYSNLYSCICANFTVTSRCNSFDNARVLALYSNFTALTTLNNSNLEVYALTVEGVLNNSTATISVLSTLSAATLSTLLVSLSDYNLLLETVAKLYYDWSTFDQVNALFVKVCDTMIADVTNIGLLDNETITLEGNGFIYRVVKLNAATTSKTSYFKLNITYSQAVTGSSCLLTLFNRTLQGQPAGPVLFLYEPGMAAGSQTRTIWLPSEGSLSTSATDSFLLQRVNPNSNTSIATTINSAGGMFSYTTDQGAGIYTIVSAATNSTTANTTAYDQFRIENMFYRPSIFYILFFLLLYIVFVPLCLFVDFVDLKTTIKHKRVTGREQTHEELQVQDPKPPSQESAEPNGETEIVVPISYKQFHPIYNIATTQHRPTRIAKLCLYLLNLQHSLFYMVVLYNAAPIPRTALLAILMVIPAYILNILSCYLFGFIKNKLPGNWKFLINVVPPCYWVAWFFLINQWTDTNSPNYQTYLIIFTIVCFFLDQIFDLLQMMIMFFVLREDNQVYPCLARILSVRGFFEYDKYSTD